MILSLFHEELSVKEKPPPITCCQINGMLEFDFGVVIVLKPPFEIQGVKFFDSPSSCMAYFEKAHWTKKAMSFVRSFGTLFSYIIYRIGHFLRGVDAEIDPLTNDKTVSLSKGRLVVCIHGLNDSPSQFKKIIDEMEKRGFAETDIFIPRVLRRGNAKLDEMVEPIFEMILKWAQTSGEKELVLVGISNGGRIARALEAKLVKSESIANIKKLRFISIVGACKGSSIVNFINKVGLSWALPKNISIEMATDSARSQQLNQDWLEGLSHGPQREYTFIASLHDWEVTNYDSSLLDVPGQNAHYAIILGHGHNSIVNAAAKPVAQIILTPL